MSYRQHQQELINVLERMQAGARIKHIVAHVVPGGGKSWLPALVAQYLSDYRIAWFVPRSALRTQAARGTARDFSIQIRDSTNDVNPSRGTRGFVTTYQALAENPRLWADELRSRPYVVVSDERHHLKVSRTGKLNSFAKAWDAFPPCLTLTMTGTLETNDNTFIHGFEYDETDQGWLVSPERSCDEYIRYNRETALREGAIVPVEFFHFEGPVNWETLKTGPIESTLRTANMADQSKALGTALKTELFDHLLREGVNHWLKHGRKLLVVCLSQADAKKAAKEFTRRSITPYLAITDNQTAADDIEKFKSTDNGVLITCQMAYEGLDDRDLTHAICLTHIRSVPWIEQMFGRIWRHSIDKYKCWAFVPDDRKMNRVIQRIHEEQIGVIGYPEESTDGPGSSDRDYVPLASSVSEIRSAGLDGCDVYNPTQQRLVDTLGELGVDRSIPEVRALLARLGDVQPDASGLQPLTVSQTEKKWSKEIWERCKTLDKRRGAPRKLEWGTTQSDVFRHFNKSTQDMTTAELQKVLQYVDWLETQYA